VWSDIAQHQGLYHQNWHIEDNPAAETAFAALTAAVLSVDPSMSLTDLPGPATDISGLGKSAPDCASCRHGGGTRASLVTGCAGLAHIQLRRQC
jgi:hypothetical protein